MQVVGEVTAGAQLSDCSVRHALHGSKWKAQFIGGFGFTQVEQKPQCHDPTFAIGEFTEGTKEEVPLPIAVGIVGP